MLLTETYPQDAVNELATGRKRQLKFSECFSRDSNLMGKTDNSYQHVVVESQFFRISANRNTLMTIHWRKSHSKSKKSQ
ncbi:hypothetical protein BFP76_13215 [Amylibacter kogurei]|uniref:Uncharacterized protein n=1 Tax=Paramylibacter kogurei TaxID=1889778 RepID=A0A2G5KA71_9RHOB|nr:hypothetical protein BFP76_13215 [Amylibacter kogurei]